MEKIYVGIISALLLAILKLAWKEYLVPIWIELFIEKIKIYKVWFGELKFSDNGEAHKIKLELEKLGNKIEGSIEFISGTHKGKKYPLSGRYHTNILTFYYYPKDKKTHKSGRGCFSTVKRWRSF